MKNLAQVAGLYKSETLDGRDIDRLVQFIPEDMLPEFGLTLLPEYVGKHQAIEFTRANVLEQLDSDVAFGFYKALNKRGLSSSMMFQVVCMWNWILEEGLEDWSEDDYAQYGLPLFKATALKYGFDNPIGSNYGNEHKYSSEG